MFQEITDEFLKSLNLYLGTLSEECNFELYGSGYGSNITIYAVRDNKRIFGVEVNFYNRGRWKEEEEPIQLNVGVSGTFDPHDTQSANYILITMGNILTQNWEEIEALLLDIFSRLEAEEDELRRQRELEE